jgi:arylsulfatase A-like enzyme
MMNQTVLCLLAGSLTALRLAAAGDAPAKPNIVLFLADDLGYGDIGCYGGSAATPYVDRLAQEGVRFTSFYANGPECSPTRTALLTGRYQQRVGGLECAIGTGNVGRYDDAIRLCAQHDLGLPVSEVSLARRLKEAGYATALIGKWHLGYEDKFAPNAHGFDHAFYCLGGGMDNSPPVDGGPPARFSAWGTPDPPSYLPVLRLEGAPIRRPGYITDLIAEDAIRWLRQAGQRPFFLYVPFTAPHAPYQGPEDGAPAPLPADSSRWKQGTADPRVYAAMIERMDQAIGRILDTVNELGAAANTLVIFASDNGGTRSARQGGLRGYKGSTFEGGIRVPCIVRWPGVLPANLTTEQVAVTMDLTASLVRAAGAAAPVEGRFDGLDILQRLQSRRPPVARTLYWRARRGEQTWRAVRDGALKYVSSQNGKTLEEHLFDLEKDMGEKDDLLARRPEEVARLQRLLASWEKEVQPRR